MKTKLINTLTVLTLTSALTACMAGNTAISGGTKPGEVKTGIFGMNTAADVKADGEKAFAGVKDVVIASFVVGFTDSANANNKASGGFMDSGFGGKSTALVKLEGVNNATRQAVADAAYADFVSKLKAKGYNVVSRDKLLNYKEFEGVKQYDMPYKNDTSGFMSSYGGATYFAPSAFGKKTFVYAGDIEGVSGGFAFGNPGIASGQFAQSTGTKVLHVAYLVDFANAGGHAGITSSSINVGQGISVRPGAKIGIIGDQGGTFSTGIGTVSTGQAVYSTKEFGTVTGESSDGYKAVETVTNVIGILGGVGSNTTREYSVKADAGKYKAISTEVAKQTNTKLTDKMASLK